MLTAEERARYRDSGDMGLRRLLDSDAAREAALLSVLKPLGCEMSGAEAAVKVIAAKEARIKEAELDLAREREGSSTIEEMLIAAGLKDAARIAELEMTVRDLQLNKYPVLVVCALIVRDGRVLLERHARSYGNEGYFWDIPGGKVECGETPRDAVIREIREELGVTIKPLRLTSDILPSASTDSNGTRHWLLATWECRIIDGEPSLTDGLQWFDVDSLPENVKSPDREIILESSRTEIWNVPPAPTP